MSIIDLTDIAMNDTFEPTVLPKGEEAKLRLININDGIDKNGNAYIMPFFESTEDSYCKEFGDYLPLPSSEMNPKDLNNAKLRISNFFAAFGINSSAPIDVSEVKGNEGWAILGIGTGQDGLPVNKINKYIIGQ